MMEIETYGFGECYYATSVDLGTGLTTIGPYAFVGVPVESINIPATVSVIGFAAFGFFPTLQAAVFEGAAPEIGDRAFPYPDNPDFKIYFYEGAAGFTLPVWEGYPSVVLGSDNLPPIAHAGPDQYLDDEGQDGWESVTLDGTLSSDPDGSISSYLWRWEGGSAEGATVEASFPSGDTEVTLEVRDDRGRPDFDTLVITVGPSLPQLDIPSLVESLPTESATVVASPVSGYPTNFTYQWYFENVPVPDAEGGKDSQIMIEGIPANEGSWKVIVTNSEGSTEAPFQYRVFADQDGDGLSDGQEEFIHLTDPAKTDSDDDGLSDYLEVTTYGTSPLTDDSDEDGFKDKFEISVGSNPMDGSAFPDAYSEIFTAVEFSFASQTGASYRIESSADLENWSVVDEGIMGTGEAISRLYSTRLTSSRYYRAVKEE